MIPELRSQDAGKPVTAWRAQALKGRVPGSLLDAFQSQPNAADMDFTAFAVEASCTIWTKGQRPCSNQKKHLLTRKDVKRDGFVEMTLVVTLHVSN
jgi:hypothetical protein